MTNIWLDSENIPMVPQAAKKSMVLHSSSVKYSSHKKAVLGDLNNVMHNKQMMTPFRGAGTIKTELFASGSKSSLYSDVLRKQQRKHLFLDAQQNLQKQFHELHPAAKISPAIKCDAAVPIENNENLHPFDYMDFPTVCCDNNCQKSDPEIWADSLQLDNSFLRKIINDVEEEERNAPLFVEDDNFDLIEPTLHHLKQYNSFDSNVDDFQYNVTLPDLDIDF